MPKIEEREYKKVIVKVPEGEEPVFPPFIPGPTEVPELSEDFDVPIMGKRDYL